MLPPQLPLEACGRLLIGGCPVALYAEEMSLMTRRTERVPCVKLLFCVIPSEICFELYEPVSTLASI